MGRIEITEVDGEYTVKAEFTVSRTGLNEVMAMVLGVPGKLQTSLVDKPMKITVLPVSEIPLSKPIERARQPNSRPDLRAAILAALGDGPMPLSDLCQKISGKRKDFSVRGIVDRMAKGSLLLIEKGDDGINIISLPQPVVPETVIKIQEIPPKIEDVLPKMEPLPSEPNVFQNSPERLVLSTLRDEGPRQRENIIRLVAATMTTESEAEMLLDRMLKSGVITSTKSGRISLAE